MSAVTWESLPVHPVGRDDRAAIRRGHLSLVPPAQPVRRPGLHLTRLGRLVLTLLALAVVVAFTTAALGGGPGSSAPLVPDHAVTVGSGQTLSQIASSELPGLPLDVAVARLQLANGLNTTAVHVGEILVVPAS